MAAVCRRLILAWLLTRGAAATTNTTNTNTTNTNTNTTTDTTTDTTRPANSSWPAVTGPPLSEGGHVTREAGSSSPLRTHLTTPSTTMMRSTGPPPASSPPASSLGGTKSTEAASEPSTTTRAPAPTRYTRPRPPQTSSTQPVPVQTSSTRTGSTQPVPAQTSSTQPVPAQTSSTQPVPAQTSSTQPVPAQTSSTQPVPAQTSSDRRTQLSSGPLFTTKRAEDRFNATSRVATLPAAAKTPSVHTSGTEDKKKKPSEGSDHSKVVAGLIGGALVGMMVGFLLIYLKKRQLQKQQVTTADWAGPSPFLEGDGPAPLRPPERIVLSGFLSQPDVEMEHLTPGSTFGGVAKETASNGDSVKATEGSAPPTDEHQ